MTFSFPLSEVYWQSRSARLVTHAFVVGAIVCTALPSGAAGAAADSTKCRTPTPALLATKNGPENCAAYGASARATQNAAGMTRLMLSAGMAVCFGLRLRRWCVDQQPWSKSQSKNPYSDVRFSHLSCLLTAGNHLHNARFVSRRQW